MNSFQFSLAKSGVGVPEHWPGSSGQVSVIAHPPGEADSLNKHPLSQHRSGVIGWAHLLSELPRQEDSTTSISRM